ncbi:YdeI/OmpD-associated family protein [Flavobacterium sp. XS2P14]|uniref:YdeI/OmpD-associated family protein n=1 Tax=Flavobacterium sp. XS2P14 TaxID=3401735 RepID=UPI003AAF6C96
MVKTENFENLEITTAAQLREWLQNNHTQKESIWLVTYKKQVPEKYVSIQEVLDQLLCFGWIDGIRRKLDDERTMQLIAPRKAEHWAQTYKVRFDKLEAVGLVHQSGFLSVLASKNAGLWDFMDDVDNLIVPNDLQAALTKYNEAKLFFNAINDSSKRFVLRWIKLAKTDKTRASRIDQIVQLSLKGEKLKGS